GGPSGPSAHELGIASNTSVINTWFLPIFWFMLKLLLLLYATVWVRASLPRLRYDQLMNLGWKVLIEFAFLWAMVTGVVVVTRQEGASDTEQIVTAVLAAVGAVLVGFVLYLCLPRREEIEEIR